MHYCCRIHRRMCRDSGKSWRPATTGMTAATGAVCTHERPELINHDMVCNKCRVSYGKRQQSLPQTHQLSARAHHDVIPAVSLPSPTPTPTPSLSSLVTPAAVAPPVTTLAMFMAFFMGMSAAAVVTNVQAHSETTSYAVNSSSSPPVTPVTTVPNTARKRRRLRYSVKCKLKAIEMTPQQLAEFGIDEHQRYKWRQQEQKLECAKNLSHFRLSGAGRKEVFDQHPALKKEILENFSRLRSYGIILRSAWMIMFMMILVRQQAPELIAQYNLDQSWFNKWLREQGHWTRRTGSTCMKLPANWEQLRDKMINRMAYVRVKHHVHPRLIVNLDQTSILYLPTINSATWTEKYNDSGFVRPKISAERAAEIMTNKNLSLKRRREMMEKENSDISPRKKETPIDGHGGKKAISTVVGMSFAGDLLPLQMIYTGKTAASLPNGLNEYVKLARAADWIMTNKVKNHWSSADTMMTYIRNVLVPYRTKIIREETLAEGRRDVILLIDCWSMHVHTLKPQIEREFPFIRLMFVPANCTSKLQPCDVIANAPLKKRFKSHCIAWTCERAAEAMKKNISPSAYKIAAKVSLKLMKPLLIEWLYKSWMELKLDTELLQTGWAKCGFSKLMFVSEAKVAELVHRSLDIVDIMYGSNLKRMPKVTAVNAAAAEECAAEDRDDEHVIDDDDIDNDIDDDDDVDDIDIDGGGDDDGDDDGDDADLEETLRHTQELLDMMARRTKEEEKLNESSPPQRCGSLLMSSSSQSVPERQQRRKRVNRSNVENETPTKEEEDVMNNDDDAVEVSGAAMIIPSPNVRRRCSRFMRNHQLTETD